MLYDVRIQEILERIICIKADDMEEAKCIAEEMYKNQDIVLDYSDFTGRPQIICIGESCSDEPENL